VRDPANEDPAFARARVRGGLAPALAAVHPAAEVHLAAFAERLRDEAELLEPLVDAAWARAAGGLGLSAAALSAEAPAMRRLLLRRYAAERGLPPAAVAAGPLERALALLDGPPGAVADLAGGWIAARERGRLVLDAAPRPAPGAAPLGVPGSARLGAVAVRASEGVGAPPEPGRVTVRAEGALTLRPPRPGDRLAIAGGRRPVGRVLADAGVPARLRGEAAVVATPDRVVWVAGLRAAHDLLAPPGTPAVVLELEAAPA
jgi:tRNA(Ile)-lysidine synthase